MRKQALFLMGMSSMVAIGFFSSSCGQNNAENNSKGSSTTCASDVECKGDRICEDGVCVSPGETSNSNMGGNAAPNASTPNMSTSNNSTSTNNMSSSTFECCINDTGYSCPDKAAYDQCVGGFDVASCLDACPEPPEGFDCMDVCFEKDAETTPDPSACTEDSSIDCSSTGGVCNPGDECISDSQCDSNNCVSGRCYARDNGCNCSKDDNCDSDNCVDGQCYGNSSGDRCSLNENCSSGNCSNGKCQGN